MSPEDTFETIERRLAAASDPERAQAMSAYLKNRFPFYGLKAPQRRALVKPLRPPRNSWTLAEWTQFARLTYTSGECRELQYVLNDWWVPTWAKGLGPEWLPLLEELIQTLSWWDTVDWLASHFAGNILRNAPGMRSATAERWITADNIWLQRTAILFQLNYKAATDADLLFHCIRQRADSSEFFVQKAAGWALRQYSKVNPAAVAEFITEHDLARLTVREGSKYLNL
jgi:3-methyladenine DNA glycosylase AlkD